MFEIECPKCEVKIGRLAGDYIQWRSDRRRCPHCGAGIEISNGFVCFGLCGLIFGAVLASSHLWGFRLLWLRLAIVVVVCWAILPVIVRVVGRWRVASVGAEAAMRASKWGVVAHISRWVLIISVIFTSVSVLLEYRALIAEAGDIESDLNATEDFLAAVKWVSLTGFGIAFIALIVNVIALIMRKKTSTSRGRGRQ
ncbi:MAG: hypothetical protein JSV82_06655 [Planctomycetota bacterium]|nr:MAG: hypothetical protein JSV82_06655 [Planctomycetota bacterium]